MSISSIGALVLGEYPEAAAIMILYQIGEKFEDFAVDKSRDAIGEIAKMRPDKANVKTGKEIKEVPVDEVKIGTVIIVKAGERIPIDGVITEGDTFVDTSALTGESVPRHVMKGDEVLSGSINKQGVIEIKTTKASHDSALARILELVENATENKTRYIVVDSGNGASGFFVDKILKPLGADTTGSQFLEPDGMFPNHIPNPENKQAMEAIRSAVLNNKADLGLIFDTDVDRMSAVLSDGSEINRDSIIAMIAAILAPDYPGSTIITDSVTSDRLTYFLEKVLGLKHLCYMRGYKNVINKQKELNASGTVAPLAMETSGHGALKDNYFLDDGAFLAVKLVVALAKAAKEGKKLDSLIEKLPPLVEEGEYRFKIAGDDFKEYGNQVLEEFKKRAQAKGYQMPHSYEGIRLSFKGEDVQGWILLRLSLHDPVMPRIY